MLLFLLYPVHGYGSPHDIAYDNNDRCSNAAQREFERKWEGGLPSQKENPWDTTYRTHYNLDLNKCFMLVKTMPPKASSDSTVVHSFVLIDVYEGVELGFYGERPGQFVDPSRAVFPCEVNQIKCASKEEFERQISIYMDK